MITSATTNNCLAASRRTTALPEGFAELVQSMREMQFIPEHLLRVTDDPPEVRVARGVALLDARAPDWRSRVNVSRLELSSASCVLGQLYGSYIDGHIALGLGPVMWLEGVHHGFLASEPKTQTELEHHWRKTLLLRHT